VSKKLGIIFLLMLVVMAPTVLGKVYTITLLEQDLSPYNQEDVEYMNFLAEEFKKATGIDLKIEIIPIPAGNYSEKVNLLLAGGTYPDIIWWRDDAELPYVEQGLLRDLSQWVNDSEVFQKAFTEWNKKRFENFPYTIAINPLQGRIAVTRRNGLRNLVSIL